MSKEIINQLKKAYIAIKNAYYMNELKTKNSKLKAQLITIEEIIKKLLGYK